MKRILAIFVAFGAAAVVAPRAAASYPYIEYQAWTQGQQLMDPRALGWVANNGASGTSVFNDNGAGVNAWRVTDSVASLPNPNYVTELTGAALADAVRDGWKLSAKARYVTDFGVGANLGLSTYVNNRMYHLMFDLTGGGDLQATLLDETNKVYQLTSGGTGVAAFHEFGLVNNGGTSLVDFVFDGRVVNGGAAWDGKAFAHANTVHWGNSDAAGTMRGTMDFNRVLFEIGPFVSIPGDYDGDVDNDGADLLAWQRTLGASGSLAADGNRNGVIDAADLAVWKNGFGASGAAPAGAAVPEPEKGPWAIVGGGFMTSLLRRRIRGDWLGFPRGDSRFAAYN